MPKVKSKTKAKPKTRVIGAGSKIEQETNAEVETAVMDEPPKPLTNEEKVAKAQMRDTDDTLYEESEDPVIPATGIPGMKLVIATKTGFYAHTRIRRGNKFYIPEDEKLGEWMILDGEELPAEKKFAAGGQASELVSPFISKPGHIKPMETAKLVKP